ncbi:MAG: type II toxin-antitoxin system HicB family antitoxin [Pseudomonadota bacterium]
MAHAIGIIHEENGVFGISFPDFPGCVSTGATLDEVIGNGAQALAFHMDGMAEDGEAMPEIRSLAAILQAEPDWLRDGIFVAIPVELPSKSLRINITVEERALERIDRAAAAEGMSRSGFLVAAATDRARQIVQTGSTMASASSRPRFKTKEEAIAEARRTAAAIKDGMNPIEALKYPSPRSPKDR